MSTCPRRSARLRLSPATVRRVQAGASRSNMEAWTWAFSPARPLARLASTAAAMPAQAGSLCRPARSGSSARWPASAAAAAAAPTLPAPRGARAGPRAGRVVVRGRFSAWAQPSRAARRVGSIGLRLAQAVGPVVVDVLLPLARASAPSPAHRWPA
jgi:hypothetical protein